MFDLPAYAARSVWGDVSEAFLAPAPCLEPLLSLTVGCVLVGQGGVDIDLIITVRNLCDGFVL